MSRKIKVDLDGLFIRPFAPVCWYNKELDWFFYQSRDCSITELQTKHPGIEVLQDNATGQQVGFKILNFSSLPQLVRTIFLNASPVEPKGIEDIWIQNMQEQAAEINALEAGFFEELRALKLQ